MQKQLKCQNCQENQQKVDVITADYQFELKKNKEDLAVQKVAFEMFCQKDLKKYKEKFNKEKQDREKQNKNWIEKYDSMVQTYEKKLKNQANEAAQRQEQKVLESIKHWKQLAQQTQKHSQKEVQKLRNEIVDIKKSLTEKSEKQKKDLLFKYQQKIKMISQTHLKIIDEKEKETGQIIKQFQIEKKQATENYESFRINVVNKEATLQISQMELKNQISSSQIKIKEFIYIIQTCEKKLIAKNEEIDMLKETHEHEMKKVKNIFEFEKEHLASEMNGKIQQILKRELKDCEKYEETVKKIEEKRNQQVKLIEGRLEEVKVLVNQRPSRDEDIEHISVLKDLLNSKERQLKSAMKEARQYQLELDNRQENFNKIFTSNPLNIESIKKQQEMKKKKSTGCTSSNFNKESRKWIASSNNGLYASNGNTSPTALTSLGNLDFCKPFSKTSKNF